MARKLRKPLAMFLAVLMCFSTMAIGVSAAETDVETVWYGDSLKVQVEPGKDGYTFKGHYAGPYHSYEISNHYVATSEGAKEQTQIFMMLDASGDEAYTWTPNGKYSFGTSNYDLVYCCDVNTGYVDGAYYKRTNLEDSTYFTPEAAEHIRAIVTNSYPYVSMKEIKANLAAAGFEGAEDLTRAEIIAAVQAAIWFYANGGVYSYNGTYDVSSTTKWGAPVHDFTNEMDVWWNTASGKFSTNEAVAARVNNLIAYLKDLKAVRATPNQIVVSNIQIVDTESIDGVSDAYKVTVEVGLNNSGSSAADQINLDILVNGNVIKTEEVKLGTDTYTVEFEANAGDTIKAVVYGTQVLPQGVYFYEPEGGRGTSQSMVGAAMGETDIHSSSTEVIVPTPVPVPTPDLPEVDPETPVNKTADGLDENYQTNVTLTVPGDKDNLGVDIIYILGGFLSEDEIKTNTMINGLMDTFSGMIDNGITVNFGVVPFSSTKNPVLALTPLKTQEDLEALPAKLALAIKEAGDVYDAVNMENALVTAKEMFSASELAEHPERQHLVMVSSGHTYYFNGGADNETISTVPVMFKKGTVDTDEIFYMEKAWMRARNNSTNSYPIPKAIVEFYNANTDKYASAWECYWAFIDMWAKADIAAGDQIVYNATTREAGDFISWFNSGKYSSATGSDGKGGTFTYSGHGAVIANPDASQVDGILKFDLDCASTNAGPNPFEHEFAAHAISYERAMWEAYEYVKANIVGAGINFYPIYNPLRADGTASNGSTKYYDWTDQYIGHCFMNMLAGGEAIRFVSGDTSFLKPIQEKILYTTSIGSTVEDFIGKNENGNFEFIQDASVITLNVGGKNYITTQIETKEGATASYAFTAPEASEPTFWLDYYYGDGKTTERFVWTFGENVSFANVAKLTYKLQLTEKQDVADDEKYIVPTNNSATLYPVDSNGNKGEPVDFPVPKVDYTVEETPDVPPTITFNNGDASNISFMLVDPATGEVEFLNKIDIGGETSFEIPTEEGKISAVFVKQSTSGMFWTSESISEELQAAVIDCLKAHNPSYKGHYPEFAVGNCEFTWEFKKNKAVTYIFEGCSAEVGSAPEASEPAVEETTPEATPEEEVTEPAPAPETSTETIVVTKLEVAVKGAEAAAQTERDGVAAVYIAAKDKVPAVVWTSDEVDEDTMASIIEELGAPADAKQVVGAGAHKIEYKHNKNKTKTVTYTFEVTTVEVEVEVEAEEVVEEASETTEIVESEVPEANEPETTPEVKAEETESANFHESGKSHLLGDAENDLATFNFQVVDEYIPEAGEDRYAVVGHGEQTEFWTAYMSTKPATEGEVPVQVGDVKLYTGGDGRQINGVYLDGIFYPAEDILPGEKLLAAYNGLQQGLMMNGNGKKVAVYCADHVTGTTTALYDMVNIEDATHFDAATAAKIRAVAANGYWGGTDSVDPTNSLAKMKAMMAASGKFTQDEIDHLTPGAALSATQFAIWELANADDDRQVVNVQYIVKNRVAGYNGKSWNTLKITPESEDACVDLIFKLSNYLTTLDGIPVSEMTTANTVLNYKNILQSVNIEPLNKAEGHANNADDNKNNDAYVTNVTFDMLQVGAKDKLVAKIVDAEGKVYAIGRIAGEKQEGEVELTNNGNGTYTFPNVTLIENEETTYTVVVEGVQYLERNVYLYFAGERGTSQTMIGYDEGEFSVDIESSVKKTFNVDEPETPPTVSFNSGDASNISFMLIDKEGNVEFVEKVDVDKTSYKIPTEEGKVSAVFVKQGQSGMFWTSQEIDAATQEAVIDCLKAHNPSYKGHWPEFAVGNCDFNWEFKAGKSVTYKFEGEIAHVTMAVVEPVAVTTLSTERVVEEETAEVDEVEETEASEETEVPETPVVDEPVVEETTEETVEATVEEEVEEEPVVEETKGNNGKGNGKNKKK